MKRINKEDKEELKAIIGLSFLFMLMFMALISISEPYRFYISIYGVAINSLIFIGAILKRGSLI